MEDRHEDERRWRQYEDDERWTGWRGRYGPQRSHDLEAYNRMNAENRDAHRQDYGSALDFEGYNRGPYSRDVNRDEWESEEDWSMRRDQNLPRRFAQNYKINPDREFRRGFKRHDDWERWTRFGDESMRPHREGSWRGAPEGRWEWDADPDWQAGNEGFAQSFQQPAGPFTGVGPRGYRRSDDRICEDVCERLTWHGQIDASDIEVEVQNSEVSLRGTVNDRRMKRLAEDIAESVPGVVDINNQLRLRGAEGATPASRSVQVFPMRGNEPD